MIFIFLIVLGAENLSYVKSIETHARTYLPLNISAISSVQYHILGVKGWKIFPYQFTSIKQTIHFDEHPLLRRLAGSRMIELTYRSHNAVGVPILRLSISK